MYWGLSGSKGSPLGGGNPVCQTLPCHPSQGAGQSREQPQPAPWGWRWAETSAHGAGDWRFMAFLGQGLMALEWAEMGRAGLGVGTSKELLVSSRARLDDRVVKGTA